MGTYRQGKAKTQQGVRKIQPDGLRKTRKGNKPNMDNYQK